MCTNTFARSPTKKRSCRNILDYIAWFANHCVHKNLSSGRCFFLNMSGGNTCIRDATYKSSSSVTRGCGEYLIEFHPLAEEFKL